MECIRGVAHCRCRHTNAHGASCSDLLDHVRSGLPRHIRLRDLVHLSSAEGWARRIREVASRQSKASARGRWRQPGSGDDARRELEMILFWAGLLAITTSLYVLLDGFDLGVGILFAFADEPNRRKMLSAILPVWDGNETWLVLTGTVLFGAFPTAYAALLSAFYLPLVLMLCALILRGVSFEFRYKALMGFRWIWDLSFAGGSLVATFIQGMTVGALVEGLPMKDGHYIGETFGWFSPFATLCGFGLVLGYSLLGASWLVRKCEGPIRERAYQLLPVLTVAVLAFLATALVLALSMHLGLMGRWLERPYLLIFPIVGAVS